MVLLRPPDRKPSKGLSSSGADEIPLEGPGRSEVAGRHYGVLGGELGNWQAALMGGVMGGELGNCQAAKRGGVMGGRRGAAHSPEVFEKCRKAGMLGKDYGIMGGAQG